eukprot:10015-Pleurochrysis_carterae.AAC.1
MICDDVASLFLCWLADPASSMSVAIACVRRLAFQASRARLKSFQTGRPSFCLNVERATRCSLCVVCCVCAHRCASGRESAEHEAAYNNSYKRLITTASKCVRGSMKPLLAVVVSRS